MTPGAESFATDAACALQADASKKRRTRPRGGIQVIPSIPDQSSAIEIPLVNYEADAVKNYPRGGPGVCA
jgi:hypothetical protein